MVNKESRDNDRDSRDYSSNNQPRELACSTLLDREINRTENQTRERVSVREPVREAGEDRGNNRESKHDLTNAITPTSEAKQPDEKKLKISTTLESDKNIAKEPVGTEKTSQTSSKSDSSSTIKEVPAELDKIPSTPVFTGRMNRAVRGVIQTKLHKRFPFAANDPRFNLAMTAIEVGLTIGTGAAVGAAWPEILLLLGANALMSYAVPLAVNKFRECISESDYKLNRNRNWLFTDNKKIMDTGLQSLPSGLVHTSLFQKEVCIGNLDDRNPKTIPAGSSRYMIDSNNYLVQYSVLRLSADDVLSFSRDPVNLNFYGSLGGAISGTPVTYKIKKAYVDRYYGLIPAHDVADLMDFLFVRHILDVAGRPINVRGLEEIDISDYDSKTASNVY